jgi:malonate transporter and related proteins
LQATPDYRTVIKRNNVAHGYTEMDILFNAIAPIFLIVLFGFLLGKFKLLSANITGALMQYVIYGAGPGIVFYAIISNPISKLLYWRFWVAYPVSLIIVIAITAFLFKFILKRSSFVSMVAGFGAAMANTVIIGYPVLAGFIGHTAAIPMAITVLAFAAIFIPVVIFVFEIKESTDKNESTSINALVKSAILDTLKNPMVIAVIIAVVLTACHIPIPKFISKFSFYLGESIIPVALFSVGLDLSEFKAQGNLLDVSITSFINLVISPLVAIGVALLLHMSPVFAVALVIFSSVPTAKTLYMISGKYQLYNKEVAAIISMTTVFAVITIPFYTYIAKLIWPSVF